MPSNEQKDQTARIDWKEEKRKKSKTKSKDKIAGKTYAEQHKECQRGDQRLPPKFLAFFIRFCHEHNAQNDADHGNKERSDQQQGAVTAFRRGA